VGGARLKDPLFKQVLKTSQYAGTKQQQQAAAESVNRSSHTAVEQFRI